MKSVTVQDASGAIVWVSPPVENPLVEIVDGTLKVFDFESSQVVATYAMKPGETVVKETT